MCLCRILCWNLCKNHIFYKVKLYELLFARNISFSIIISIEWSILGIICTSLVLFFSLWCIRNWTCCNICSILKLLTDCLVCVVGVTLVRLPTWRVPGHILWLSVSHIYFLKDLFVALPWVTSFIMCNF